MRERARALMVLSACLTVADTGLRAILDWDGPEELRLGLYLATVTCAAVCCYAPIQLQMEKNGIQTGVQCSVMKLLLIPFFLLNFFFGVFFLVFGLHMIITLPLVPILILAAWLVRNATSQDLITIYSKLFQIGLLSEESYKIHLQCQKNFVFDVLDGLGFLIQARDWSTKIKLLHVQTSEGPSGG